MGPISGLVVAPIVGVLSDRCTSSFGRRRPFILSGTIFCIIGMLTFANARRITFDYLPAARLVAVLSFGVLDFATNAIMFPSRALLGDLLPPEQQHPVQSAAAVTASLAEIIGGAYLFSWKDPVTNIATIFLTASVILAISCSISLVVCKERPMTKEELMEKNRREAEMNRVQDDSAPTENEQPPEENEDDKGSRPAESGAIANGTIENGERQTGEPMHAVDDLQRENGTLENGEEGAKSPAEEHNTDENDQIHDDTDDVEQRLAMSTPDETSESNPQQVERSPPEHYETFWSELSTMIRAAVTNFPRPLVKVGIVYGLAWFLWFASLPFYSQWLGVDVLQGDPHAAPGSNEANLYQQGVTIFSVANSFKAVVAMMFAAFYPSIIAWVGNIGERVIFGGSFLVFSSVLYACAFTKNIWVAAGVIALGSVPFIVTQTIPIAIVVQRYPEHLASNLGVLNLFCVIPQLVDTLYTGKVAELAGESTVLRVAAGWGFAASIAAFCFL